MKSAAAQVAAAPAANRRAGTKATRPIEITANAASSLALPIVPIARSEVSIHQSNGSFPAAWTAV